MSWNITEIILCWDFIMEQGSCHYDFKLLVKYMHKEQAGNHTAIDFFQLYFPLLSYKSNWGSCLQQRGKIPSPWPLMTALMEPICCINRTFNEKQRDMYRIISTALAKPQFERVTMFLPIFLCTIFVPYKNKKFHISVITVDSL